LAGCSTNRCHGFEDEIDGAKFRKSNIIQQNTTPCGPKSVPTETKSGTPVDQRELQKVVMISQARVVVIGAVIETEPAYDPKSELLRA
jgi:hypothetical protein